MNSIPSNPFPLAVAALTSPNARAFYSVRAQQDLGVMVWAIATAATMAYQLGVVAREFVDSHSETTAAVAVNELGVPQVLALPGFIPAGYLPPAKPKFTKAIALPGTLPSGDAPIILPAPKPQAHKAKAPKARATKPQGPLPSVSRDRLRSECRAQGLPTHGTKAELLHRLVSGRPSPTKIGGISID